RDFHVTGVQTCALPIFLSRPLDQRPARGDPRLLPALVSCRAVGRRPRHAASVGERARTLTPQRSGLAVALLVAALPLLALAALQIGRASGRARESVVGW